MMQQQKSHSIAVLSGRYPLTTFDSPINHIAYCKQHGYTYIHCHWPSGAINPYMNKMRYVQAYYNHFDYIFWIDDDAFFMDIEKPLDDFIPQDADFLSICSSPDYKDIHTYISSGQFMLRCNDTGRDFIDEIEKTDLNMVKAWWKEELGYFSNGDQDAMVYQILTNPKYSGIHRHHFSKFNSRVEDFLGSQEIFILHFTGRPEIKEKNYKKVQRISGRLPNLLAIEHQKNLNLKQKRPLTIRIISRIKRLLPKV